MLYDWQRYVFTVQELIKTCAGTERTCIQYTSVASARLRGQGQLGYHLAAVYSHAQLNRFYPDPVS